MSTTGLLPAEVSAGQYALYQVDTVAALRAIDVGSVAFTLTGVRKAFVAGYANAGDKGGGEFYFASGNADTDDGITTFAPDNGYAGRWKRLHNWTFRCEQGGVLTSNTGAQNYTAWERFESLAYNNDNVTVVMSPGTYLVNTNLPFRTPESAATPSVLRDYRGLTIRGSGRNCIIKTNYAGGADVFQLRAVKNITIEKIGLASEIDGSASGSNGVSITSGGLNIRISKVHVYEMPFVEYGPDTDGGQAFTLQSVGATYLDYRNIRIENCSADGGSYGINFQMSEAGVLTNPPQGILAIGNYLANFYRGINVECSGTGSTTQAIEGMSFNIVGNTLIDCQQDFRNNGVTGVNWNGNTARSSAGVGGPGIVTSTATQFGFYSLSSHRCNFVGNVISKAYCAYYAMVGGGWAGEANTPTDRLNMVSNQFFGLSAGYGINSTTTTSYGFVTNSHFAGNTFESITTAEYHNNLRRDVDSNAILTSAGTVLTSIMAGVMIGGEELITGWTQGGTPFGTLTVDANGHDITSLIGASAGKFCGMEVNLTVGRWYELTLSTTSANLGCALTDTLATTQNGSYSGLVPASPITVVFKADANDNFLVLKSSGGAVNGSVTISLREAACAVNGALYVKDALAFETLPPAHANNAAALSGGLRIGGLYRTNADPSVLCIRSA